MDEENNINDNNEVVEYEQTNELYENLASRWKRLGGAIIDSLISILIIIPIMLATGTLQKTMNQEQLTIGEQVLFIFLGGVVFLLAHGYLLYKRGQTVGKFLINTKIVDLQGNVPNFGKLLVLRYFIFGLIALIPFIGGIANITNILFIFGKERRCLHDYLAGTVVINASNIQS